jgi:hypothetical protein
MTALCTTTLIIMVTQDRENEKTNVVVICWCCWHTRDAIPQSDSSGTWCMMTRETGVVFECIGEKADAGGLPVEEKKIKPCKPLVVLA